MNSTYKASDVTPTGGGYKLRLTVTAQSSSSTVRDGKLIPDSKSGDSFRAAVTQWAGKSGQVVSVKKDGKKFEGSMPTTSTAEEQLLVTTTQMEEFLTNQFEGQGGVSATVTRVT